MAAVASGSERLDPDLTPLLDVVMQLIMFFMMCINFVNEQVNANVVLPTSTSAQELPPKTDVDVLVINVEVEREDKKDASGNPIRDAKGNPEKQVKLPRVTKIIFSGMDPVTIKEVKTEATDKLEGSGMAQVKANLAKVARARKNLIKIRTGKEPAELDESAVIRADAETHYGIVLDLVAQCTHGGFKKIQLRANQVKEQ
jgi:biopolymer transport protein ExbD